MKRVDLARHAWLAFPASLARHIMMEDYRHILLIKPSSLGDIVHAMPTCAAICRAYPKARLTWLVKREWAGLVERIEGVDRVWPVESTFKGWLSQVSPLRAERFDLVVDLQGLFRSAAIGWLSGSPLLVGFENGREGSPWFYSRRVPVSQSEMHAVDRYLLVAKAVGVLESGTPEFRFRIPQTDYEEVDRLLSRSGVTPGTSWVAMNVSARWPTKRWPAASFAEVADRLQQEGCGAVVMIGGPDERTDVAAVSRMMKTSAIDLAGATTVGLLPGAPEQGVAAALRTIQARCILRRRLAHPSWPCSGRRVRLGPVPMGWAKMS